MKSLIFLFIAVMLMLHAKSVFTQTGSPVNYQAVARDAGNLIIANKPVSVRFSIHIGSENDPPVYVETHTVTTNQFGLFTLAIGKGEAVAGIYEEIDWSGGNAYLRTEIDPAGGTNYREAGIDRLLSVPYANFAVNAKNIDDADADPENELQTLTLNGNQLGISRGNAVTLPNTGGSGGDNWGEQTAVGDVTIDGDGTLSDPLRIAAQGAEDGDILKWNGEIWKPDSLSGDNWGSQTVVTKETLDGDGTDRDPLRLAQLKAEKGDVLIWSGNSWLPGGNYDGDWSVSSIPANHLMAMPGGITVSSATVYGSNANTHINLGFGSASGEDGEERQFVTISGGINNSAGGDSSVIGGGADNITAGLGTTVGGGIKNSAYEDYSTVAGGFNNSATFYSAIGGGTGNKSAGYYSAIAGGSGNIINLGFNSSIGGGNGNEIDAIVATIAGGSQNSITDNYSTIGGGKSNSVEHEYSFIGGGEFNEITNDHSVLSGGYDNLAGGRYSTVSGGSYNSATAFRSVIAGGSTNKAFEMYASIGGGFGNEIRSEYSTISGGINNKSISGNYSVIGGGRDHFANGEYAVISGGRENNADGVSSVIAGGYNNDVNGNYSIVGGGRNNIVNGDRSVIAGGSYLTVNGAGTFAFRGGVPGSNYTLELDNKFLILDADFYFNQNNNNVDFRVDGTKDDRLIFADASANLVGIGREPVKNRLEVNGNASKSTAGNWLSNSDRRIKRDIRCIEDSFETILKLNPVIFRYNKEYLLKNPGIENKVYYNFIAQEYADVFPGSVKGSGEFLESGEEILQIDSYNAQIVSIKAVQELIQENIRQKEEIKELRQRIERIERILNNSLSAE